VTMIHIYEEKTSYSDWWVNSFLKTKMRVMFDLLVLVATRLVGSVLRRS
jgi:hypothetical protein